MCRTVLVEKLDVLGTVLNQGMRRPHMRDTPRVQQGGDPTHWSYPVKAGELEMKKSPDKEAVEVRITCGGVPGYSGNSGGLERIHGSTL